MSLDRVFGIAPDLPEPCADCGEAVCECCDRCEITEDETASAIARWLRRQRPTVELEPADARSTLSHPVHLDASRLFAMAADAIEAGEWKAVLSPRTTEGP